MSIEQLVARRTSRQTSHQDTSHQAWAPLPPYGDVAILDALPEFFEKLPVAAYACDAQGRVLWFNAHAAELWGRTPAPGPGEFTGAHKMYFGDRELHRDETPIAEAVRTGTAIQGLEAAIERPDGSSILAVVYVEPVKDEDGIIVGAVGCLHEVTSLHAAAAELAKRRQEQAALHDFTSRLQHAVSVEDVHELALEAIIRALACQRASILQFDRAGRMRFVAQRGLSDTYRQAVDGHSPWTPESGKAQAICIGDVERAGLPEDLRQALRTEGIGALAFIPLKGRSGLLGKFMAYYDAAHVFDGAEMEVAEAIGRQLLFALERIRAEEESARASRAAQQLAAIVESSDDAIVSKDLNGVIQTWNRGAQRVFGYRAEEVIGKPVTILMPPDRIDEEPGILARIRRGERIEHYETVRRCKDGRLIDISLTVSPIRDCNGRITGASKIARNITERKTAETAVRESERRLQDLLSTIPAAIYTTDAEGRVTYFNEAAVALAGRTPKLGSDQWCVTWKLYWPDGTPMRHDECPMAVALKEGRTIRNAEAVAERPDGTRVPFIPYPTLLRDEHGKIAGAINMLVDVSERRQAETQQRMLLRELNHRVKNNMQMLQSLLYAAAKKTRNPEASEILDEASRRITAMAAAQRVLYATTDATNFQAGEFLEAVCQSAQQTLPPNVKIVRAPASGELSNDAAMPLALILNELLTNAAKYGVNGSGDCVIRVGLTREAGSFVLYVEDDGPGFDLKTVASRSSGLGLVQGLAAQLRGQFEVTRNPATRCTLRFA